MRDLGAGSSRTSGVGFAISGGEQTFVKEVCGDEAFWFLTNRMTFLASPEETNNAYSLVHTLTQCNGTPPPHVHAREDEAFYMIQGSGKFLVGGESYEAKPGTVTYLPRGLAHAPILLSENAEVLILVAPGDYANFFKQQSIPAGAGLPSIIQAHMPVMEDILDLGREFGLTFLPPGTAVSSWPIPDIHTPPCHIDVAEGERLSLFGHEITIKLEGFQTNELFSMFEIESPPESDFPAHRYLTASEGYYVLEGEYEFTVEGRSRQVGPGAYVYVPANSLSGFRSDGPGKLLLITATSGHERFFRAAAIQDLDPSEALQHGFEFKA